MFFSAACRLFVIPRGSLLDYVVVGPVHNLDFEKDLGANLGVGNVVELRCDEQHRHVYELFLASKPGSTEGLGWWVWARPPKKAS